MVVKLVISVSSAVKEVEVSLQGQILGFMMWKTMAFKWKDDSIRTLLPRFSLLLPHSPPHLSPV